MNAPWEAVWEKRHGQYWCRAHGQSGCVQCYKAHPAACVVGIWHCPCGHRIDNDPSISKPWKCDVDRCICDQCFGPSKPVGLVHEQAPPTTNDKPAIWDLVVVDMQARDKVGRERYGTRLQPHNGRDALVDMYQELLDAVVYCRQAIFERDGK